MGKSYYCHCRSCGHVAKSQCCFIILRDVFSLALLLLRLSSLVSLLFLRLDRLQSRVLSLGFNLGVSGIVPGSTGAWV